GVVLARAVGARAVERDEEVTDADEPDGRRRGDQRGKFLAECFECRSHGPSWVSLSYAVLGPGTKIWLRLSVYRAGTERGRRGSARVPDVGLLVLAGVHQGEPDEQRGGEDRTDEH